jgi:hypothetical protein
MKPGSRFLRLPAWHAGTVIPTLGGFARVGTANLSRAFSGELPFDTLGSAIGLALPFRDPVLEGVTLTDAAIQAQTAQHTDRYLHSAGSGLPRSG